MVEQTLDATVDREAKKPGFFGTMKKWCTQGYSSLNEQERRTLKYKAFGLLGAGAGYAVGETVPRIVDHYADKKANK